MWLEGANGKKVHTFIVKPHGFKSHKRYPLLINVHGGGMQRCDTIAEGIAVAVRRTGRKLPIVARFAGNNADFASVRLKSAGVEFIEADDMTDAVRRAVKLTARPR